MKCATCGFITDPAKDLCSRCFSDLRKEKIALGFAVVNPSASYEDLLAKRVKIVDASSKAEGKKKESPKLESKKSFSSIFRRKSADLSKDTPKEIQREINSPDGSEALKVEEAGIDSANVQTQLGAEVLAPEAQKLKLGKRQKQQLLGLLRKRKTKDDAEEHKSQIVREAREKEQISSTSLGFEQREIPADQLDLWSQSFQELGALSSQISLRSAIQVSSLLRQDSQAALSIYFDLAFDDLAQPGKKREFITHLGDRKVDSIESTELKEAVGQYQQESARLESADFNFSNENKFELIGSPATNRVRLLAWLLDFGSALTLSLILGVILQFSSSPLLSSMLLDARSLSTSDLFSIAIFALPIFYLLVLFLFPLARNLLGFTIGEYLTRLRLVSVRNHKKVSFFTSLGWTLLSALACLSFGLLELKEKPERWRERILGARLLRT